MRSRVNRGQVAQRTRFISTWARAVTCRTPRTGFRTSRRRPAWHCPLSSQLRRTQSRLASNAAEFDLARTQSVAQEVDGE